MSRTTGTRIKQHVESTHTHISAELFADLFLKRDWQISLFDVLALLPVTFARLADALPYTVCKLLLLDTQG